MTPRELFDRMMVSAAPVDLFSGRGTHKGCGACCSRFLPLTMGEAVVLRRKMLEVGVSEQKGDYDFRCPLLTDGGLCAAYDVRPAICRCYDCAKHAGSGAAALAIPFDARYQVYDMRELIA